MFHVEQNFGDGVVGVGLLTVDLRWRYVMLP